MFFLLLIFLLLLVAVAVAYYKMTKTTPTQTNKKRSGETNNDKASKKREIEDPASSEGMYIFKCIIFIINNVINFLFDKTLLVILVKLNKIIETNKNLESRLSRIDRTQENITIQLTKINRIQQSIETRLTKIEESNNDATKNNNNLDPDFITVRKIFLMLFNYNYSIYTHIYSYFLTHIFYLSLEHHERNSKKIVRNQDLSVHR